MGANLLGNYPNPRIYSDDHFGGGFRRERIIKTFCALHLTDVPMYTWSWFPLEFSWPVSLSQIQGATS